MLTSDFDYDLPPELIAQEPLEDRPASRMLVLNRATGENLHRHARDIPEFLRPGDLLVLNDTKVFPARAFGAWEDSPGRVEVLFIEPDGSAPHSWLAVAKSSRPARPGRVMMLADGLIRAEILGKAEDGTLRLALQCDGDFFGILDRFGVPPVPPYIRREALSDPRVAMDRDRYQTVYARERGAVAAPTAGLHFTKELLDQLDAMGVRRKYITLHVGPGTFKPVKADVVEEHKMESERYVVPEDTAEAIAETRRNGGRVVAVGSTTVRTLETVAAECGGEIAPRIGRSSIFIRPPFDFRIVDCMLTNFHLPKSTLIMMISALAGRERVLAAYREAINARYRFYSYGDCMLII